MGKLLQLIAKLFGKNAISKTLGTRTNVIKLPSNEKKRLIKDELNIEAASDLAAQKVLKEAEDLIADIPKMNDQEVLTFTGNLQRLDNKINPPSAEVLDLTTKKPVTGEGLEQLAARDGLPADVSPDSPIGRVMQGAQRLRKEKDELDKMLKDPAKQLEQEMQNPYRSGGPLDPKMGIVRTAARQVLQKLAREGKINIADEREAKAIIEGYQGGVDPIEVFRKTFGQDALGDLANLGDELLEIDNRGGSFKDIKKILDDEGFFDLQQPKNPVQGRTDEELMKLIKDEDPEKFATGGRVGFDDGGILSLEEAKKLNPGMFVDTTTYNPIPENAPNMAADEIAKIIMGTGFLPEEDDEIGYPEGMEKPMSSKLFIFEEYVIPQRKKMMENFGLTLKEADDLIRQEMEKYRTNKATGGRVGYAYGSGLKLVQLLQKAGKSLKQAIKEAVDNINPTGDKKLDADMAIDDMLETYSIDKDAVDGYDILNAYDEAYKTIANPKTMSEVETLEAMGANITAKTLELVEKYPGLNSELARKIASDPDPQRQAEVISTIEQAFELMKQGKSSDEVLDIMKQMTDRTKQAGGGLSYLSGF
jgi:hypothetical protein